MEQQRHPNDAHDADRPYRPLDERHRAVQTLLRYVLRSDGRASIHEYDEGIRVVLPLLRKWCAHRSDAYHFASSRIAAARHAAHGLDALRRIDRLGAKGR